MPSVFLILAIITFPMLYLRIKGAPSIGLPVSAASINLIIKHLPKHDLACAGPQYARRDIQVSFAPSVSAHLCDVRLRLHRPRLPCVRNDTAHRAASMLPQWLYGAMRLLLRPSTRAYLVLRALASLSLARSECILSCLNRELLKLALDGPTDGQ